MWINFFSHKIQAVPPVLSCGGKQRIGTKADLLHCFESCVASKPQSTPEVDAIILDGAVVVHMLHPGTSKTFQEYADFVEHSELWKVRLIKLSTNFAL